MDSSQMKMEKVIIISCMFAASSAIFFPYMSFPTKGQNVMSVCVYSMDPTRYQPKCFLCPTSVYSNVLQACLNAATIPRNITYTQARCLEQNCLINRGKRSVDLQQPENLLEEFGTKLPLGGEEAEENAEDPQNGEQDSGDQKDDVLQVESQDGYKVVGSEEFMASDVEDYLDYSDMGD